MNPDELDLKITALRIELDALRITQKILERTWEITNSKTHEKNLATAIAEVGRLVRIAQASLQDLGAL